MPLATVPGNAIAEILGRNERMQDSPIMQKLGLHYFDAFQEQPLIAGEPVSWLWQSPEGPPLLGMQQMKSESGPIVTVLAPEEVDKGLKAECWVSGCRVQENLKKCEFLQSSNHVRW